MSPSPCPCSPSPAGAEPWLLCPAPALAAAPRPGAWQSVSCAAASGPAAAPLLDGTGAAAGPAPAQAGEVPSHPWGLFFFFGTIFGALNQDKEQSNGLKIDQSVNCCLKYFIIYCLQPALCLCALRKRDVLVPALCLEQGAAAAPRTPQNPLQTRHRAQPKGRASPRVPSPKAPSSPGLIQLRDLLELAFNLQTFTISFELI